MKKMITWTLSLLILILLWQSFNEASQYSLQQDEQRIKDTIQTLLLKCYSIEGRYPESLEYLKENYGLLVNLDDYRITYHYEGANVTPAIDVYKKEGSYETTS